MLIHAWMYCSYYDRLLIMGDDMFIIAYEQAVIMHDQRHIHVIMNIIVNPTDPAPIVRAETIQLYHPIVGRIFPIQIYKIN